MNSEFSYFRIRPKASRLLWPTLILTVLVFALTFFAPQIPVDFRDVIYIAALTVAVLFWAIPVLNHVFGYLELTNRRLILRSGFLGLRKRQVAMTDISSIEIQKAGAFGGKVISLWLSDESELLISGYARCKLIASEIERVAKAA